MFYAIAQYSTTFHLALMAMSYSLAITSGLATARPVQTQRVGGVPPRCSRDRVVRAMSSTAEKANDLGIHATASRPDATGRFGKFGGKYVPETLIVALTELEQAYAEALKDPSFTVCC